MGSKSTTTYEEVMRSLKERHYEPVYYLMGEESYYIDKIADYIIENVLQPHERDFNLTVLFGTNVTTSQVVEIARRYPLMSERQVVVVKEAQALGNLEALEQYLRNPQKMTLLVFCHKNGSLDARLKVVTAIQREGILFESKKLKERDLPSFIEKYIVERNVSIDRKSQQMIADAVGCDLVRLISLLEKILTALPKGEKVITPALVASQSSINKDFNSFELRDAIVHRDIRKANIIVKYFNDNPKAGNLYSALSLLFNYFENLLTAYYCPNKSNPEILAKWLDLKSSWATRDYITGIQNYKGGKVMQIIGKMRDIDAKGKGINNPSTPAGELLRELIFFILH